MNSFHTFRFSRTLLVTWLLAIVLPGRADTYTWANAASGNWNNAQNWSPNGIPGGSDTAVFSTPGTYTVSTTDNEAVNILQLGAASGTVTLNVSSGTFTVNGTGSDAAQSALIFSGGTITGPGSITLGGPLTWSGGTIYGVVYCQGGGTISGSPSLVGGQLFNSGLSPLAWEGLLITDEGSVINNSGIISITSTASSSYGTDAYRDGTQPVFNNSGTLNVGLGTGVVTGTATIGDTFNNTDTGTVNVSGGTLNLQGGGTETGGFAAQANATLQLSSGNWNLGTGCGFSGLGADTFSGGIVTVTGGANVTLSTPNVNIDTAIYGPGSLTLTGALNWSGGTIYGVVYCQGGGTISGSPSLVGGQLFNSGLSPLAWEGLLITDEGSVINNSGIISITSTASSSYGTDAYGDGTHPVFNNSGTLNVGLGTGVATGTATIGDTFNNTDTGTVNVSGGTLNLQGGGTETGGFAAQANATLQLSSGNWNFGTGCGFSGLGADTFSGGDVTVAGGANVTLSTPNVNIDTAIYGPGSLTLTGALNWSGGTIYGVVYCQGGGTISGSPSLVGGQLFNSGLSPLAWEGLLITDKGSVINNSGIISITSTASSSYGTDAYGDGTHPVFNNSGTLNVGLGTGVVTGTATIGDTFNNTDTGTVNVSGGTLNLQGGGTETGGFAAQANATLQLSSGNWNLGTGCGFSGLGADTFSGGIVTVTGGANVTLSTPNVNIDTAIYGPGSLTLTGALNWSGGTIYGVVYCQGGGTISGSPSLVGGQLFNSGLSPLAWEGLLITDEGSVINNSGIISITSTASSSYGTDAYGDGTHPVFNNSGTLNVGLGTGVATGTATIGDTFNNNSGTVNIHSGTLRLLGGYTGANCSLDFGISSASSFGQLVLPGALTLNNTTLGATAYGYTPSTGDSIPLITYTSETGVFSAFNIPPNANWQPVYGKTAFSLNVASTTAPYLTLQVVTPVVIKNGFTLLMLGPSNANYKIEAATSLNPPNWVTVVPYFLMTDSSFYYTDTTAASTPFRIFQAVMENKDPNVRAQTSVREQTKP